MIKMSRVITNKARGRAPPPYDKRQMEIFNLTTSIYPQPNFLAMLQASSQALPAERLRCRYPRGLGNHGHTLVKDLLGALLGKLEMVAGTPGLAWCIEVWQSFEKALQVEGSSRRSSLGYTPLPATWRTPRCHYQRHATTATNFVPKSRHWQSWQLLVPVNLRIASLV